MQKQDYIYSNESALSSLSSGSLMGQNEFVRINSYTSNQPSISFNANNSGDTIIRFKKNGNAICRSCDLVMKLPALSIAGGGTGTYVRYSDSIACHLISRLQFKSNDVLLMEIDADNIRDSVIINTTSDEYETIASKIGSLPTADRNTKASTVQTYRLPLNKICNFFTHNLNACADESFQIYVQFKAFGQVIETDGARNSTNILLSTNNLLDVGLDCYFIHPHQSITENLINAYNKGLGLSGKYYKNKKGSVIENRTYTNETHPIANGATSVSYRMQRMFDRDVVAILAKIRLNANISACTYDALTAWSTYQLKAGSVRLHGFQDDNTPYESYFNLVLPSLKISNIDNFVTQDEDLLIIPYAERLTSPENNFKFMGAKRMEYGDADLTMQFPALAGASTLSVSTWFYERFLVEGNEYGSARIVPFNSKIN